MTQVAHIKPSRGWGRLDLHEVWQARELVWFMTTRDVKGRYRQMALGPLWIVLKPLINMVIFSAIFGGLAKLPSNGIPYPIFTYTALLPWTFFSNATSTAVGSLVTRLSIISKVYFPRLLIPISAVLSGLIDLAFSFLVLLGMLLFYGFRPSLSWLALPLYVLLAAATALAVGLWGATIAVKFRDTQYAASYGLQVWMYASPVAYAAHLVPERWQLLYQLNPLFWVIEGFRWAILGIGEPIGPGMAGPVVIVAVLLVSGAYVFRRTERTIVDLI